MNTRCTLQKKARGFFVTSVFALLFLTTLPRCYNRYMYQQHLASQEASGSVWQLSEFLIASDKWREKIKQSCLIGYSEMSAKARFWNPRTVTDNCVMVLVLFLCYSKQIYLVSDFNWRGDKMSQQISGLKESSNFYSCILAYK